MGKSIKKGEDLSKILTVEWPRWTTYCLWNIWCEVHVRIIPLSPTWGKLQLLLRQQEIRVSAAKIDFITLLIFETSSSQDCTYCAVSTMMNPPSHQSLFKLPNDPWVYNVITQFSNFKFSSLPVFRIKLFLELGSLWFVLVCLPDSCCFVDILLHLGQLLLPVCV